MNWTDELVKEFAKVTTEGAYGLYSGCKTTDSKLEKFKEVVKNRPHRKILVTLTRKYYKSTEFEVNVPSEIKEDDVHVWINENISCTYMDDKISEASLNGMEHDEEIDSDRYDISIDGKHYFGGHL